MSRPWDIEIQKATMGSLRGTTPAMRHQAGKLAPTTASVNASNETIESVGALIPNIAERVHQDNMLRRDGSRVRGEVQMRGRGEREERRSRYTEDSLGDCWLVQDGVAEEPNGRYAVSLPGKQEELGSANERADPERRYRLDDSRRNECSQE